MEHLNKPSGRDAETKTSIISKHPFFIDLPPDALEKLASHVRARSYERGDVIFSRGDPGNFLFYINRGTVKIVAQSTSGKNLTFNLIKEGEFFGEIAVLDGLSRSANAIAFSECELMLIDRRDLLKLLKSHPPFLLRLIALLCARLRRTTDQVEELMFIDLNGRLARTLLELSALSKTPGRICIAQREIAEIAGVSRETANKQLRKWEKENIISISRNEIKILDARKLTKIVSAVHSA